MLRSWLIRWCNHEPAYDISRANCFYVFNSHSLPTGCAVIGAGGQTPRTYTGPMSHAVARLRAERLARSTKPFLCRGGVKGPRCDGCRLPPAHCICAQRPVVGTRAGFCLLMGDIEPIKPSNTGWLVADVVPDTHAFGWSRTEVDPALLALLADPIWQPHVVFPAEYAPEERVVTEVSGTTRRPLFILLDGTWSEARKMFRKSPYMDHLPVLSLSSDQASRYRLRRSHRDDHFCTSEVASLCLAQAGEPSAAQALDAHLEVFTRQYLRAKNGWA